MKRWGIYLIIMGIGSLLLPMMGLQFRILMFFGEATPVISIVLLIIGIFLIVRDNISENKHVQSIAGNSGNTNVSGPGSLSGIKCYACKADISQTDTVCPKCQTPL